MEQIAECLAVEELRDHVGGLAVLAYVIDGQDVRVIERGGRKGLLLESTKPIGVGGKGRRQHLDGDLVAEPAVGGPIDPAHSASAQLAENSVVTDP